MPNPVVFLPGYYGSLLSDRLSGEVVWLDGYHLLRPEMTLQAIRLDSGQDDRMVASGVLDEVYLLPFLTPVIYKPWLAFLRGVVGAERVYPFYLDWRRSVEVAAADLALRIRGFLDRLGADRVDLVAHSHGGLVARRYLDAHPHDHCVDKLVTLGTPHKGMLETFRALVEGISFLDFPRALVRDVSRSFPSAYELLPVDAADGLFTWQGAADDPFARSAWATGGISAAALATAGSVVQGMPTQLPVDTTLVYGTHVDTLVRAQGSANGTVEVTFDAAADGDGTVPRVSASGNGLGGAAVGRFPVPFGEHSLLLGYPAAQRVVKDTLLGRSGLRPHFAVGWRNEPVFLPYTTNALSVELRDGRSGDPLPGTTAVLSIPGRQDVQLPSTAEGDFFQKVRMPPRGKHFEWRVVATAPALSEPMVASGMLFAANV